MNILSNFCHNYNSLSMYVQYGCGHTAPEGWINFDSSATLRWERFPVLGRFYTKNEARFPPSVRWGDIVAGLPISQESAAGVYASHVLEHLALRDFHAALENTRRILKPEGIFRAVVPDLRASINKYLAEADTGIGNAAITFMQETYLGRESNPRSLAARLFESLRTSRHLWMWDQAALSQALAEHGFRQVRPCRFGDCADPMFRLVEHADRFNDAVAIEARK